MKTRYVKRKPSTECGYVYDDLWYDPPMLPHLTVDAFEAAPRFTGILDKEGHELIALELPEQIGFLDFDK